MLVPIESRRPISEPDMSGISVPILLSIGPLHHALFDDGAKKESGELSLLDRLSLLLLRPFDQRSYVPKSESESFELVPLALPTVVRPLPNILLALLLLKLRLEKRSQ